MAVQGRTAGVVLPASRGLGFTLPELLITVALVAVLLAIAAPAYSTFQERERIRREVTRLQLSFFLARSEAVKRGRRVVLCPSPWGANASSGATPAVEAPPAPAQENAEAGCGGVFEAGWMLFVDENGDRQFSAGEPLLRRYAAPRGVTVSNRRGTRQADEKLVFRPDGSARRALTLLVCSAARPELESRGLVVNRIGRPRIARGWGQCPGTEGP